jgi:hypothetical protein
MVDEANQYPKALYHKDGGYKVAATPEEEKQAGEGWSDKASPQHFNQQDPALKSVPTAYLGQSATDIEAIIRRVIREELGSDENGGDKPRRGRPPGSRNTYVATASDKGVDNG